MEVGKRGGVASGPDAQQPTDLARGEQVAIMGLLPSVFSRQPHSARSDPLKGDHPSAAPVMLSPSSQCSLFDRFSGPYGGLLLYKDL